VLFWLHSSLETVQKVKISVCKSTLHPRCAVPAAAEASGRPRPLSAAFFISYLYLTIILCKLLLQSSHFGPGAGCTLLLKNGLGPSGAPPAASRLCTTAMDINSANLTVPNRGTKRGREPSPGPPPPGAPPVNLALFHYYYKLFAAAGASPQSFNPYRAGVTPPAAGTVPPVMRPPTQFMLPPPAPSAPYYAGMLPGVPPLPASGAPTVQPPPMPAPLHPWPYPFPRHPGAPNLPFLPIGGPRPMLLPHGPHYYPF
jgi:hypothetical protein